MVDVNHIQDQLFKYFQIMPDTLDHDESQAVHIDPVTGLVDVYGTVILRNPNHTQLYSPLPVKFGHVRRNFNIAFEKQYDLLNLINFPHTVDGDFRVVAPNLTSLLGAPRHVGGVCVLSSESLKSLEHLPESYGRLRMHYTPHLPLLRLIDKPPVGWSFSKPYGGAAGGIVAVGIIERHFGKGKPGAIKAAAELIKFGFKENARW
jgi:hypothetical protein